MKWVGIDTGTSTGLAVWDAAAQRFDTLATVGIVGAMRRILDLRAAASPVRIVAEDARQRKWLPRERSNAEYRGRLMGAGSVKRDAAIWEEFAAEYGIPLLLVPPRKGLTKWSPETFARITGYTGRTSEHARDAALLVFGRKDGPVDNAI